MLDAAVTGSVQLRTDDGVFNRMLFATPDGGLSHYDKRHLFSFARENERYAAGRERVTVHWKGWSILLQVCYDLRFPVFSRNRFNVERPGLPDYDLALYVANWPSARAYPWKTLLRARAIENLSYVVGVNRVGTDGSGLHYSGDSAVIDFLGHAISECTDQETGGHHHLAGRRTAGASERGSRRCWMATVSTWFDDSHATQAAAFEPPECAGHREPQQEQGPARKCRFYCRRFDRCRRVTGKRDSRLLRV